ncbi:MAG: hypothetical protein KDA87_24460, partial [Planctomycetales bacterium]|nr:hypothetical protein [Planctomycetales bacterium]
MNTLHELKSVFGYSYRLFKLVWSKYRRLLSISAVVIVLVSCLPFLQNYAVGELLNKLVRLAGTGKFGSELSALLVLVLVAGSAFVACSVGQYFLRSVLYKELFQSLAVLIHRKVAELDIPTHENPQRKNLITKVQENAMWRAPDFVQRMMFLTQNTLECIIATAVFINADWIIGSMIFASMIPRLIVEVHYNHALWKVETGVAETRRKFWHTRWFLVDVRALTEVKLFQNVRYFVDLLGDQLGEIKDREIEVERRNLRNQLLTLIVSEGASILAIIAFVNRVIEGTLEVGSLAF